MSWYNIQGNVEEITFQTDLYYHDVLRIPNWPTKQAATQHPYKLNTQQAIAIFGGDSINAIGTGGTSANSVTGGKAAAQKTQETTAAGADILGGFNLSGWFLRIGEVLLGVVLIGVGIARITGAQNAISAMAKTKLPIPIPV